MASAALTTPISLLNTYTNTGALDAGVIDLTVLGNVVAQSVVATVNSENQPTVLHLGATSNLVLQSLRNDVNFYTPHNTGSSRYFATSNGIPVREYFVIGASNSTTFIYSDTNQLHLKAPSTSNTIRLGEGVYYEDSVASFLSTNKSLLKVLCPLTANRDLTINGNILGAGWAVNQMKVLGSMSVDDHIVVKGNVFGCNLNVVRDFPAGAGVQSEVNRVGFGMRVNDNMQLEVIRYTRYTDSNDLLNNGNKLVTRRVAVFGGTDLDITDTNNVSYTEFNQLQGASVSNVLATASNYLSGTRLWPHDSNGNIYFNGGFVGVMTSNPTCELDVNGAIKCKTANIQATISVADIITTSDMRTKKDIFALNTQQCLDGVLALEPVSYTPLQDPEGNTKYGFVAQAVEAVLPSVVRTAINPAIGISDCRYLDMLSFIPLLVGSVKNMQERLVALEQLQQGV